MNTGVLIEFCGVDGSGKTTQAENVVEKLKSKGFKAKYIHPFKHNSIIVKELKRIAGDNGKDFNTMYSERLKTDSYTLDMIYNTFEYIVPLINEGYIVIVDKYISDSNVYIPFFNKKKVIYHYIVNSLPHSKIQFFIDTNLEVCYERVLMRKHTNPKNLRNNLQTMIRAREEFIKNNENIILINGDRSIEDISNELLSTIVERIRKNK